MDEAAIVKYITTAFQGVETTTAFGYLLFFYRSERRLPFATMIGADTEQDRISDLDRPGVFRLNIGVSRQTFAALFGTDKVNVMDYDYTALDVIMPHPEYWAQRFICVLTPSETGFDRVRELLAEAYEIAARRYARRSS